MSQFGACSARISGDRQTHTHTQTDTQNDYCNPRCACAPRVNNGFSLIGNNQLHMVENNLYTARIAYLCSLVLPPLLQVFASTITMTVAMVILKINTTATTTVPPIIPLVLSVPLSVGLHTTSQLATLPLATLQEREMELAVMELTDTKHLSWSWDCICSLDKHRAFFLSH